MQVAHGRIDARRTTLQSGERVMHDLLGNRADEGDHRHQIEQLPSVLAVQRLNMDGHRSRANPRTRWYERIAQHAHRLLAIRLHIMT